MNADLRRDVAANRPGRAVPNTIVTKLGDLENKAETFGRLSKDFQPEYGGVKGAVRAAVGSYLPGGDKGADWWKDYRMNSELVERHEMFGAALTASEQAAWRAATISPGMDAETIQRNLEKREALATKVYNKARDRYQASGYNVGDAFQPRPEAAPSQGGAGGSWGAPTAPAGKTVKFGDLK
jgi:hypothetical protein